MSSNLLEVVIPTGQNAIHLFCNAFNPAKGGVAPVQYSLQQNGHVWMKVYTLGGEFVRTLFDEQVSGASVTSPYLSAKISWDGRNDQGVTVASGVYLVHLEAPGFHSDARVAVIK
jgi:flagellar hook assembly protein FlgD